MPHKTICDTGTDFLRREFRTLTLTGALSTRNGDARIYSSNPQEDQRKEFKKDLREELENLEAKYAKRRVKEKDHIKNLSAFANRLSEKHAPVLYEGRIRFGVAQKLVNLYLKYLWVIGLIKEPPHCPIDGIISGIAKLEYNWTVSDSKKEYRTAIEKLAGVANPRSIAVWELQKYKPRE